MTNSINGIEKSNCIFIIGSNTTANHPLISRRIMRAKEKGARLIVADPRGIQLSQFADIAIRHQLGSDVALLNGMMHIIIENGWNDTTYINERTEGYDEFASVIHKATPEITAAATGVDPDDLYLMARYYGTSKAASLLYAMGITQHTTGVDNVKACCNIAMLCGNVGIPGGGVNPLRGQNNVQGACDMGGLPNVYTGYQPVADIGAQEKFSKAWNCSLSGKPGLTITDMIPAIFEGKLKALYVIGENPKLSDPDWNHLNHALKKLEFMVVQELFLSETAQVADVIFSASALAEKAGTFTNTERRCMKFEKAIEPLGDTLPDWQIFSRLSTAMGYPMQYESVEEIFDEIVSLTPSYGGMSYDRLGYDGLQWPCPTADHPGTVFMHQESFSRGRGKFHPVVYQAPAEKPDSEFPFFLTTGRMFAHFHTGTMTRTSPHLDIEQSDGYVEINPEDAQKLLVAEGEMLTISSKRGHLDVPARLTTAVNPGTLFLPIHFGENPANILTSAENVDPLAKIPEFKVSAVNVVKSQPDTNERQHS